MQIKWQIYLHISKKSTFFDRIKAAKAATSALDDISIDTKAAKRLVDGHLLIDRNGKSYTAHGAELR